MKRANLLLTDQPSSEVKMATTGHSTPSGSTRTKAAKSLFSHFMFLASLLLIALLTSGKALAQEESYTVTLTGTNITITEGTTVPVATRILTLHPATGFKLPAVGAIQVSNGSDLVLNDGDESKKWTYAVDNGDGKITLGSAVTGNITITASGVPLSSVKTLKTLTYQVGAGKTETVTNFTPNAAAGTFTVNLEYTNKNITVTGVATDDNAEVSDPVIVSAADAAKGATITVTPEDKSESANYVVMFTIPKDKLDAITVPGALTGLKLASRMTEDEVLAYLAETYATFDITTEGEQEGLSLDVVWTLKNSGQFNASPKGTNNFTWSVEEAFADAGLDQNGKNLTGDVTITNADAAVTTTISSLSYVIDDKNTEITEGLTEATINIVLPYETTVNAAITVKIACADNATAKISGHTSATEFPLTLTAEGVSLALVITAEDGETTRNVTINFTIEEELVTAVSGVPANYILSAAVADENEAIALLNAMDMTGITLTANSEAPLKLKWAYSEGSFNNGSGQSNNFTWTVVKEDDSAITADKGVEITGTTSVTNYTASTEAGISALTYQVAGGTKATIDPVKEASETNDVTVAYGTKSITVSITPTDAKATVSLTDTPEDHGTLVDGVTSYETPVIEEFKFTITAEDKTTTKNFIIKFTVDKEKITAVTVPATYKLPATVTDAKAAIALLADMEGVIIKTNGTTPTKLDWTYDKAQNETNEYTAEGGKTNVFTWSAVRDDDGEALDAASDVTITGTTTVTNFMEPVTGNTPEKEVEVTTEKPIDKIGDGSTPTIVKSVEIADGASADLFTINNAEIKDKLELNESVREVILNKAIIPEVTLASGKETKIILQSGNTIDKITNEGTLTLQDDATAPTVAALSMDLETRAGLTNNGAVGAVENNGVFTDKTATIVVVGGNADLSLTSQPKNQSTYGQEATLAVVAETTTDEAITYQWQKNIGGVWTNANGTGNNEATLTVGKTGDGAGSFRCKVVSTKSSASTTLYTQTATVTFLTESGPSEPSNPSTPTYTVSLDKVAGATFSKGETTTVDEGDNFSFKITLDKDYDQSKPVVTVDGKAITADADGNYTIKNIQKDIKIIVSGIVKNTATGIEENVADAARAWSVGSTLYIHVPETADVYVVSGTGALQQQLRGVSGDYNMQLRAGFYIVRIGEVSQKVIIR